MFHPLECKLLGGAAVCANQGYAEDVSRNDILNIGCGRNIVGQCVDPEEIVEFSRVGRGDVHAERRQSWLSLIFMDPAYSVGFWSYFFQCKERVFAIGYAENFPGIDFYHEFQRVRHLDSCSIQYFLSSFDSCDS